MKRLYLLLGGLLATSISAPATAGIFADDLARCTVSSSTPADRTILVRWIFIVAAANPAFSDLAAINETERQEGFRRVAGVYNRLLLHDCRRQSVAALQNEGSAALESGFRALGQLAGREMMSSPASMASLQDLLHFLDTAGLDALRREAGIPAPATTH